MLEFLKAPFLVLHFSYYTLLTSWWCYVTCNIAIYADDTTLYSKCDLESDMWQQLKWAFELESDLGDSTSWARKWLVDSNAGKTRLILFDRSNNTGAIDVKMEGSVLDKKPCLKILGLTFSSKLDWSSCIISIAETVSKKIRAWFVLWSFFPLRLLCIYIKLAYDGHAWNTIVMSWLVLLVATTNCYISWSIGYAGLLVLHLLHLSNPCEKCRNVGNAASVSLSYRCNFGRSSSEVAQLVPLPHSRGRSTRYSGYLDSRISMSTVSFLAQLDFGIVCL